MKLFFTLGLLLTASIGFAQEKENDATSIRTTLEALIAKAKAAENELSTMRSKFGENHPSIKQAKSQLAKLAEAETQMAAQYAMSKLREGNNELQKHVVVLSEQAAKLKSLMSDEIGKRLKGEYIKLHSNIESVISVVQSQIKQSQSSAERELFELLRAAKIDPNAAYEKYKYALEKSLDSALKDGKNAIETEKRYIESIRQKMDKQMAELQSQQERLSAKQMPDKARLDSMLDAVSAQKAQMQAALEAAKKAKAIADKQKQFMAENAYKDSIKKADKQNKEGVDKALKKFDAIQKSLDQKTAGVDKRLKGVEAELAEVKSLLKKLLEKSK